MTKWQEPGSAEYSSYWKPRVGQLVGIEVESFEEDVPGYKGELFDTIYGNVTVFDGEMAGETFKNAEIQKSRIVRQLKSKIGESVLGRVDRDHDANGSPFILLPPTAEDIAIADGEAAPAAAPAKKKRPFDR